jgi:phosphatidylglycerophosphate synthase
MYVCRPVAAVLVDVIKETRITPNQITLAAVVVAAAAAALLLVLPGHQGLVIAVAVYEVSYVLDCADGMLARWRGVQSTPGHLLDFLMDEIKAFVVLGAVAVRLFQERADPRFLLLGIVGLVALASGIALTTFQRRPEIAGPPAEKSAAPPSLVKRAIRAIESVAKFLIHYPSYILYAAIAGHIEYYFYPYIAVNAVYALRAFAGVAVRFGRK